MPSSISSVSVTFLSKRQHLFLHAGIRPNVPLEQKAEDDLPSIPRDYLKLHLRHHKLLVHAHTAIHNPIHFSNRINLDWGAGYVLRRISTTIEWRETGPFSRKRANTCILAAIYGNSTPCLLSPPFTILRDFMIHLHCVHHCKKNVMR